MKHEVMKFQIGFNAKTEREERMIAELKDHSCKSGFLKDLLWQYISQKKKLARKYGEDEFRF
jgi:Uma2 family endonuclease